MTRASTKTTKRDLKTLRRTSGRCPSSWGAKRYLLAAGDLLDLTVAVVRVGYETSYRVTTAADASLLIEKDPRYCTLTTRFRDSDVMAFIPPATLERAACERLGVATLEEEAAAKAAAKKTSEARFTCPICFGEYKTEESSRSANFGGLVDHGYRRPGHGFRDGQCIGVGRLPFEVSAAATREHQAALTDSLHMIQVALDAVDRVACFWGWTVHVAASSRWGGRANTP